MESRRKFLTTVGGIGTIAIAGCTDSEDASDADSEDASEIELIDSDFDADSNSFVGFFDFENEGEEDGSIEVSTEVKIGTDGVYATHRNETTVTVPSEGSVSEEILLADRTSLSEAADNELANGYRTITVFIDGDEAETQPVGDQPSQHVSFRVLYNDSWQGALGEEGSTQTIQGNGDAHLPVNNDAFVVSGNAQKQDDSNNELVVQIIVDGDVIAEEGTTGDFGVAQVAAEPSEGPLNNPREPYEPAELNIEEAGTGDEEEGEETEVVSTEHLTPEEIVVADQQAFIDGDGERARELTHTESPSYDEDWESLQPLPDDVSQEIVDTQLVEEDEQEAIVRQEIIEEYPEGRFRFVYEVTLRQQTGWKIWEFETIESEELD